MEFKSISKPGYEEIISCHDEDSGLRAIIAIHNTKLGPALGGIRMLPYADENEALKDVLLLAKAMSYKAAAAHLKLGGGKAVILGDPITRKTNRLLKAMGKFVHHLNGRYIAAKDAGITTEDLVEIARETPYVTGLPESGGGSGDPSPWTAKGILEGIRACAEYKWKRNDLTGLRIALQGVGHVGLFTARLLQAEKVHLIISDINLRLLEHAKKSLEAEVIAPEKIYSAQADIFAPCALGGIVNPSTLAQMKCNVIAGGANNQLADEFREDRALTEKGILYAPDYIINAGGLINIYVRDILKEKDPMPWIQKIRGYLMEIFRYAADNNIGTAQAANELTERLLSQPSHPIIK